MDGPFIVGLAQTTQQQSIKMAMERCEPVGLLA